MGGLRENALHGAALARLSQNMLPGAKHRGWLHLAKQSRLYALIAVVTVSSAICCTRTIYNPQIKFPPRSSDTVKAAILQALARRGWLVQEEGPGALRGILNGDGKWEAVIRIEYTGDSYSIRHLWSRELMYSHSWLTGEEVISWSYNGWMENLVSDINAQLQPFAPGTPSPLPWRRWN